jgi:hypothetical protein
MLQIPEGMYPVSLTAPVTTASVTTDVVSLKNAQMAWIVVHVTQAVAHATLFTPMRTTAVGTGGAVLANVVPIWYGNVSTTSNALARQTNALNYTMGGTITGDVYIIFQIDPANLGTTYDCVYLTTNAGGDATSFMEVTCWMQPKFSVKVADQFSYITD